MLFQWILGFMFMTNVHSQVLPDYWTGKVPTTHNGTNYNPVPFKIYGSNREFNQEDSPRDDEIIAGLANITLGLATNVVNPTNEPPANKSGTVSKRRCFLIRNNCVRPADIVDDCELQNN